MSNLWELEEAEQALSNFAKTQDRSYLKLCSRYIDKALERVRCKCCHEGLADGRSYMSHFKGYLHTECAQKYKGRLDYTREQGE